MSLSPAQMKAIESGKPVVLLIDHTECVVLRKDIYDQAQKVVDDEWSDEELRAVASRTVLDADGPIE